MFKKIDQEKFVQLCQARDKAAARTAETSSAKKAAIEAHEVALQQHGAACNDLDEYLKECAGDHSLGTYRR